MQLSAAIFIALSTLSHAAFDFPELPETVDNLRESSPHFKKIHTELQDRITVRRLLNEKTMPMDLSKLSSNVLPICIDIGYRGHTFDGHGVTM